MRLFIIPSLNECLPSQIKILANRTHARMAARANVEELWCTPAYAWRVIPEWDVVWSVSRIPYKIVWFLRRNGYACIVVLFQAMIRALPDVRRLWLTQPVCLAPTFLPVTNTAFTTPDNATDRPDSVGVWTQRLAKNSPIPECVLESQLFATQLRHLSQCQTHRNVR